jgi:hypothetical protein
MKNHGHNHMARVIGVLNFKLSEEIKKRDQAFKERGSGVSEIWASHRGKVKGIRFALEVLEDNFPKESPHARPR